MIDRARPRSATASRRSRRGRAPCPCCRRCRRPRPRIISIIIGLSNIMFTIVIITIIMSIISITTIIISSSSSSSSSSSGGSSSSKHIDNPHLWLITFHLVPLYLFNDCLIVFRYLSTHKGPCAANPGETQLF